MSAPAPEVLNVRMGPPMCSNRCVFCFDRSREEGPMLTLAGADAALEEASARTRAVIFTGTEPTLNPALEAAIGAARRRGYELVGLVTNGRRLRDAAYCARLLDAGLTEVRVSLHGPDAATHDGLTGRPGAFAQARAGLENLARLKAGRRVRIAVNCVVVKANVGLMREVHALAAPLCDQLNFNVVEPLGAAEDRLEEVMPRYRDVLRAAHETGLDFRSPALSLSRVPMCAGGYDWFQETWLLREEGKLSAFDPRRAKVQGPPCRECEQAPGCPGVWRRYAEAYGWEEFTPRRDPGPLAGKTLKIRVEEPVSSALRRGWQEGYRRVELDACRGPLTPRLEGWAREARDLGYPWVEVVALLDAGSPSLRQTLAVLLRLRRAGLRFAVRGREEARRLAEAAGAARFEAL